MSKNPKVRACRVCGCTDDNCYQCIEKTGGPCHWVEADLCSACVILPESIDYDDNYVPDEDLDDDTDLDPDDEEDDFEREMDECGQIRGGGCMYAGTEYCDWECPFSRQMYANASRNRDARGRFCKSKDNNE